MFRVAFSALLLLILLHQRMSVKDRDNPVADISPTSIQKY